MVCGEEGGVKLMKDGGGRRRMGVVGFWEEGVEEWGFGGILGLSVCGNGGNVGWNLVVGLVVGV